MLPLVVTPSPHIRAHRTEPFTQNMPDIVPFAGHRLVDDVGPRHQVLTEPHKGLRRLLRRTLHHSPGSRSIHSDGLMQVQHIRPNPVDRHRHPGRDLAALLDLAPHLRDPFAQGLALANLAPLTIDQQLIPHSVNLVGHRRGGRVDRRPNLAQLAPRGLRDPAHHRHVPTGLREPAAYRVAHLGESGRQLVGACVGELIPLDLPSLGSLQLIHHLIPRSIHAPAELHDLIPRGLQHPTVLGPLDARAGELLAGVVTEGCERGGLLLVTGVGPLTLGLNRAEQHRTQRRNRLAPGHLQLAETPPGERPEPLAVLGLRLQLRDDRRDHRGDHIRQPPQLRQSLTDPARQLVMPSRLGLGRTLALLPIVGVPPVQPLNHGAELHAERLHPGPVPFRADHRQALRLYLLLDVSPVPLHPSLAQRGHLRTQGLNLRPIQPPTLRRLPTRQVQPLTQRGELTRHSVDSPGQPLKPRGLVPVTLYCLLLRLPLLTREPIHRTRNLPRTKHLSERSQLRVVIPGGLPHESESTLNVHIGFHGAILIHRTDIVVAW